MVNVIGEEVDIQPGMPISQLILLQRQQQRGLDRVNDVLRMQAQQLLTRQLGQGPWDFAGCKFDMNAEYLIVTDFQGYQYANGGMGKPVTELLREAGVMFETQDVSGRLKLYVPHNEHNFSADPNDPASFNFGAPGKLGLGVVGEKGDEVLTRVRAAVQNPHEAGVGC